MTQVTPPPRSSLSARIWLDGGAGHGFPERETGRLGGTTNSGICFSGGGMRSLSATMGQLRGLTSLGLIPCVRYISCVSGGARAGIDYTYYRRGARDDGEFLGPVIPPEKIDWASLARLEPSCVGYLATKDPTATMFLLHQQGVPSHRLWTQAAGIEYLAPFGLFDPNDPAFFALDAAQVVEIRRRNPGLRDATFYTVRSEAPRPYLIAHGVFVVPAALSPFRQYQLVDIEYTPLYVGNPHALEVDYESLSGRRQEVLVGGGFLEAFAFGSPKPLGSAHRGLVEVEAPARPFELADVSGTATASFSAAHHNLFGAFSPQLPYWPVTPRREARTTLFNFGDGGDLEDYGIISLLLRRVENIAVFINTGTPLNLAYEPSRPPGEDDVDYNLGPLFGYPTATQPDNQVFAKSRWSPLIRALQAAKSDGRTVMTTTELEVLPNRWWGVAGGGRARVLWIYNDRVADWESRLEPSTGIRRAIEVGNAAGEGPFKDFPTYPVSGENRPGSLALTPEQINLLADLSCWNVTDNADVFEDLLGTTTPSGCR